MRRALIVLLLGITGCAGQSAPDPPASPEPETLLPANRLDLPEYDPDTFRALIEELRGTPIVVNIWGSWCPPCRVEAPDLAEVSQKFEGQVQFLGVDILDEREAARDFIMEFDWQYPSVFDPRAQIRDAMGYVGQPVTVIHGRDGEIAWEWQGAVSAEMLEEEIRKVL